MRATRPALPPGPPGTVPGSVRPAGLVDHADQAGHAGPARGFTLVEVMVALSAGVLVSMAAFMLSKNATAFFQREARVASAQLSLTLGMNRLTSDIQRASLLSTANFMSDPNVCRQGLVPPGLQALAGLSISVGTQTAQGVNQSAPVSAPDQIIIGGSMDSSEVYQVQSITAGSSGGPLITMRAPLNEPATYRAQAGLGADLLFDKLEPVFYPTVYPAPAGPPTFSSGRIAHIYHPASNFHTFGVIDSMTLDSVSGAIKVQLQASPALPVQGTTTCGVMLGDTGGGWLLSVVSRVQYAVQPLSPLNQYNQMVAPPPGVNQAQATGDAGRTELVRSELDVNNAVVAGSPQVIAEYAVDLRFGITVSSEIQADNYSPTTVSYAFGDPMVYTTTATTLNTPQRVRAVQVRLSTRARAPDRDTDIPPGVDGRRVRFLVDPTLQPSYARVRTNYANVALPNQGGFSLW